jgi:hypothetical protein
MSESESSEEDTRRVDLELLRADVLGALARLQWQTQDVVELLVKPKWGGDKHGYDRVLYGTVLSTMALADRLSFYMWPGAAYEQSNRLRALFSKMSEDPEAVAIAVQTWRHTLVHFGDPIMFHDPTTDQRYSWLLQWGEEHLPRTQHLTFAESNGVRVLAFGAMYFIEDLNRLAADLFDRAQNDALVAAQLGKTHERLLARQSRALDIKLRPSPSDR